jgi:hypothetical protein
MKVPISCDQAAETCDKAQYKEASTWQKFLMKMHHVVCRLCRIQSKKNGKLTQIIHEADLKTLPLEKKEMIKTRLREEMNRQQ